MKNNQAIVSIIHDYCQREITNKVKAKPHALLITLPNKEQLIVGVVLTTAPLQQTLPFPLQISNAHTYHYLNQGDNTNQPFTLQSIADCRSYIDDICRTSLNAEFNDFEITFPDGSSYLIIITSAEKSNY